jgi:hypothetical protein
LTEINAAIVQKCNPKAMQRLFKTIGAVGIVALIWAAVAETAAALADKDIISDQTVCRRGLNSERSAWTKDSFYAEEAARRGLTVDACRKLIAQQPPTAPTFNPPASTAQRSEFDILSYETGLSKSFLGKFQEAAEKLNIGPAESRRLILQLSEELRDIVGAGRVFRQLGLIYVSGTGEQGMIGQQCHPARHTCETAKG